MFIWPHILGPVFLHTLWQMFVFGEVQDPNMDTVNLVEDIVRSQLIELVRMQPECDATMC